MLCGTFPIQTDEATDCSGIGNIIAHMWYNEDKH
jgi:hypothetical protein